MRPAFHAALLLFALFEFVYMIGMALDGDYTKWNYSAHTLALWFNLVAFSTVIILWAKTIALGGSSESVNRFVLFVNAVNLVLAIAVVISVAIARSMNDYLDNNPVPCLASIVVHSLSLLAFSAWMLSYGLRLQWRLTTYPQWEPMEVTRRVEILFKINIVLVLCVVCYTLRVIALAFLLVDILSGTDFTAVASVLGWFVVSGFVPTLIPGAVLLYVMRTRKEQPSVRFTHLGAPLVAPANGGVRVEPGEEFGEEETRKNDAMRGREYSDDGYARYDRYSSVTAPSFMNQA